MSDPITTPAQMREAAALVERVAAAMWSAEAMRAALNVGHTRTPERFASWLCLAEAAIRAMPVAEPEPQAVKVKPLSEEDRDWIDARADELFRANERARGGIRNQTIMPQDFRDYFVVTATRERILSQIETLPVAQVRAEALREAERECDKLAGDPRMYGAERRRAAGQCAAAIRAMIEKEPKGSA